MSKNIEHNPMLKMTPSYTFNTKQKPPHLINESVFSLFCMKSNAYFSFRFIEIVIFQ